MGARVGRREWRVNEREKIGRERKRQKPGARGDTDEETAAGNDVPR